MTLLLDRAIEGPKTHALIIGVGNYPSAKEGHHKALRNVPNIASAADSAKLMCDWLLSNQDRLVAPLATLEVLISDPDTPGERYDWASGPVDPATQACVEEKGRQWYQRVVAEQGNVAFFYCCGHGASHSSNPVLFLEDLNQDAWNVWAHINLASLASALDQRQEVSAAFMFSDACGEFVTEFELSKAQDCRIHLEQHNPGAARRNQVLLLCAAPTGRLAYEGRAADSGLNFGRFTQVLLKGLSGSSTRFQNNRWSVKPSDLHKDLTDLRRVFFSHWNDNFPFAHTPVFTPTDPIPIVYPEAFELPLVVKTDPLERMAEYELVISQKDDPSPPWLNNTVAKGPSFWQTTVAPSRSAHYAIAVKGGEYHPQLFVPKEPLFEHSVSVP